MDEVTVKITNLKRILPACKRCRVRDELFHDPHQPVLCQKCVNVIREDWPGMVPLDIPPIEMVRECLWNHDRECNCWSDGLEFPKEEQNDCSR